jgi:ABC-type spermidine/putrescine transport system permease subunit II
MRSSYAGVLAISKELEESAFVAGASGLEMFRRVFVPLMLPAMFAGWQYSFLQTARELPVAPHGHFCSQPPCWYWSRYEKTTSSTTSGSSRVARGRAVR